MIKIIMLIIVLIIMIIIIITMIIQPAREALFLAVLGHSHVRGIRTLNFGPISMKLGGTVRAIKKRSRMTTDPVWAGITEKRPFLR